MVLKYLGNGHLDDKSFHVLLVMRVKFIIEFEKLHNFTSLANKVMAGWHAEIWVED